jgi:predicted nucleic acid-binding protein
MPPYIVLDASVAGAWIFAEIFSSKAQPVLEAVAARRVVALVPDRFAEEMLRICQKKTLPPPIGASIPPEEAWERFLEVMTLPLVFMPSKELHERAWHLCRHAAGLTTHDALYLALAEHWAADLCTLDALLAKAARMTASCEAFDLRAQDFTV